ncbi:hypothetical protein Ancab_005766 [Ancistrocladus abbreviatus]
MVVLLEARKINLPKTNLSLSSSSSPKVTSLLYDPNSLSLALMHSNSTISLYPSFSPFSVSSSSHSLPPPQTLIPSPYSASCFLSLNPKPKSNPPNSRTLFVVAGPYGASSTVLLRFYILLKSQKFVKANVNCCQNGLKFDGRMGVNVDVNHGMKVALAGSVNYFAMYSASAAKVLVLGVKMEGDVEDRVNLRLVKCAVVDCCLPISCISISFRYLVLGELNGVRLFPLRMLVRGRVGGGRVKRLAGGENGNLDGGVENVKMVAWNSDLPNGLMKAYRESCVVDKKVSDQLKFKGSDVGDGNIVDGVAGASTNGLLGANIDGHLGSVKPRSLKLRQDSHGGASGMCFVSFSGCMAEGSKSAEATYLCTKAVSIQSLSQHKLLIMDSNGDLHILHLPNSAPAQMEQLTGIMQVRQMAVLPDISSSTQTVWISDGFYSVHVVVVSESENSTTDNKQSSYGVTQAIFARENIQQITPLTANAVLVLGQGNLTC